MPNPLFGRTERRRAERRQMMAARRRLRLKDAEEAMRSTGLIAGKSLKDDFVDAWLQSLRQELKQFKTRRSLESEKQITKALERSLRQVVLSMTARPSPAPDKEALRDTEGAPPPGFKEPRPEDLGAHLIEEPPDVEPPGGRALAQRHEERGQLVVLVGGRRRVYSETDPAITGIMVPVSSSNVHSIGFRFNWNDPQNGMLLVRYLQKSRRGSGKGPGPLYAYFQVHPDTFKAALSASSKGKWVWDTLRIRGTVAGHRYGYRLEGVTGRYVPRRATVLRGRSGAHNQWLVPRRHAFKNTRTGQRAVLQSALPMQQTGQYRLPLNTVLQQPTVFGGGR